MTTTRQHFTLLAASFLAIVGACSQSVPPLINYQGKLTDAAGQPLANGTYQLRFQVWNGQVLDPTRTSVVWGQDYNVTVINGVFNVILGAGGGAAVPGASVNDLSLAFSDPNRFLGVTILKDAKGNVVNNPKEILPRQQLLSAPYALTAGVADGSLTLAKLAPKPVGPSVAANGMALSLSSGVQVFSSKPQVFEAIVTNLTVELITTGRPVFIGLAPDGTNSFIQWQVAGDDSLGGSVRLRRDSNELVADSQAFAALAGASARWLGLPCSSFTFVDIPSAGKHSYTLSVSIPAFAGGDPNRWYRTIVSNARLYAHEIH